MLLGAIYTTYYLIIASLQEPVYYEENITKPTSTISITVVPSIGLFYVVNDIIEK